MDANFDNPFTVADKALKEADADVWFLDFHAEATSEKGAMGLVIPEYPPAPRPRIASCPYPR